MPGWIDRWLGRRAERAAHNDRDYECTYWWGDRAGSAVGVTRERCRICRQALLTEVQDELAHVGQEPEGDCLDRGSDYGDHSTIDGVDSEDDVVDFVVKEFGPISATQERILRQAYRTGYLSAQANFETGM